MSWPWNPSQEPVKVLENGTIRQTGYGFLLAFYSNFVHKTVFGIFDFKNAVALKAGLGVRQGHWKCQHSIEPIWLPINVPQQPLAYLIPFPIWTAISVENRNISHPLYFAPTLKEFLLELDIAALGQKTRMMGLPGRERSLAISSAV